MISASRPSARTVIWLLVGLVSVTFVGANAHLVYVAIASQPACVEHIKEKGQQPMEFRAAAAAC
ncbi:hypothetical protein QO002_006055 [Pararhizobium capsulatum DSM 1112]|uniref:Uncharacterized protein n=1 Tax=Pararhizobium capsulatum DSM 1112 TaxID=1121113 RepID=A0ABU0BZZ8_9HYPH|nr:hypothetical protein [Pararhizobium capsulatum]MDQ0323848.1 hypothetical protein [Pararhizobium capsulatum DSM 1112]